MNILKNETNKGPDLLLVFMIIALVTMLFSSCEKEEVTTTGLSSLIIVNASPNLATYNTYLDGTKVIEGALPFGGIIPYSTLTAGDHTVKFTTETDPTALLTKTITVDENKAYSFFIINRKEDMDGLLVSDSPESYSTEKAFVRFINLSPDAPALNLSLSNGTQDLISNKSYKEVSSFMEIDPGAYSFSAKNEAQNEVKASLDNAVLVAGYYYTIMSIGLAKPNDVEQLFKLQIYTHK